MNRLWFVHALAKSLITNAQKFNNLQVTFIQVASFAHNWRFLLRQRSCITWTSLSFEALDITDQHWFALQYSWTYHECLAERFHFCQPTPISTPILMEISWMSCSLRFHFHQPTPVCTPILMDISWMSLQRDSTSINQHWFALPYSWTYIMNVLPERYHLHHQEETCHYHVM